MRSIVVCIVLILYLPTQLQAQLTSYATLKGTVTDSSSNRPLEAATVTVLLGTDSSLIGYTITNKKGIYILKDIPTSKACRLVVSYSGFTYYVQEFTIASGIRELFFPVIKLQKVYTELKEVIVLAERAPMVIRNDTLEFNAGSFKTAPDAMVEDLLRQLPGVEVDAEGNITVNGKHVRKIMVNGRDFFSGNVKFTTKNLPRDIIEKIQVIDFKSFEARFNKSPNGDQDKIINLTLKSETNKGLFGRASGGYGSDRRYESGANLNYFNGPLQLSILGHVNNTNRFGYLGGQGSISNPISSLGGGGSGFAQNKTGGLNLSHEFDKNLRINGSYLYNNSRLNNASNIRRQNILPDTSFFYHSSTSGISDTKGHKVDLNIDYAPDSVTQLQATIVHNRSITTLRTLNNAVSLNSEGDTINKANNLISGHLNDYNTQLELFVGRRLNQRGRTVAIGMNYTNNNRKSLDGNKVQTIFYSGINIIKDTLDQQRNITDINTLLNLSASFTEPLSQTMQMHLRYNYVHNYGKASKHTNLYNPITGLYDNTDSLFTNTFRSRQEIHTPNLSFTWNRNKLSVNLGSALQWLDQENVSLDVKSLPQRYTNVFPSAQISFRFSKTGNISLQYSGQSQQPQVELLQPVPDNTNPLYIRLGNPDLRPSFFNNVATKIEKFSQRASLAINLRIGTVHNLVAYETWFDSVQYSKPINTSGNFNFNWQINYSRNWKKKRWSLRITLENSGHYNKIISIIDKRENITRPYSINQRVNISYTFRDLFTLLPIYTIRYNDIRYSINSPQSTENITQTLNLNFFVNWPKRLTLENTLQYNYNSRTAPGFSKKVTMWNVAASYRLLKNKQMVLRLSAYDLLQQNIGIYRNITPTYIEDQEIQVLQQYFMASLIYNLKYFWK